MLHVLSRRACSRIECDMILKSDVFSTPSSYPRLRQYLTDLCESENQFVSMFADGHIDGTGRFNFQ